MFFTALDFTSITSHIDSWVLFLLLPHLFILSGVVSSVAYWAPTALGSSSFHVISFCLFILLMGFSRQDIEVVCHSLLQWTTFCQNSPPLPVHLGLPYMAWPIVSVSSTRFWSMWSDWLVFSDCGFYSVFIDSRKLSFLCDCGAWHGKALPSLWSGSQWKAEGSVSCCFRRELTQGINLLWLERDDWNIFGFSP